MSDPNHIEYFQNMVALAYADGNISSDEEKFLVSKAIEHDFDLYQLQELIKHADCLTFTKPSNFFHKFNYMEDFIQMIGIDGHYDEREIEFCKRACAIIEIEEKHLIHSIINKTKGV